MIFYESWYQALSKLEDKERLAAFDAVLRYGCTGEEPEDLPLTADMAFTLIKPQIDANERKAKAGKKGGRPRKQTVASEGVEEIIDEPEPSFDAEGEKPPEDEGSQADESEQPEKQPKKKPGRPKKEQEPRHKYGSNGKVLLSDTQVEKLKEEFPDDWQQWIERVDGYCQQMGKGYSDYLQTIRNWARKDQQKQRARQGPQETEIRYDINGNPWPVVNGLDWSQV